MRITNATHKAVKYACENFHYAKVVPTYQHAHNVYNDDGEWCGVIVYGSGANPHIAVNFGCVNGEVLELERVALNGKQSCTSEAVAASLKKLHKDNPLVKIVVSYADHRQRHVGTIYKATNWLYLGVAHIDGVQFFYKGKWTHPRSMYGKSGVPKDVRDKLEKRETSDKFKYIYVFNKAERKKLSKHALPYPTEDDITECTYQLEKQEFSS